MDGDFDVIGSGEVVTQVGARYAFGIDPIHSVKVPEGMGNLGGMRIGTFNVNSIRARMPRLREWLIEADPDIVALQETKVEDGKFPFSELEDLGYEMSIHGQKSYNGVAFLSKIKPVDVSMGFGDQEWPEDCRIIHGIFEDVLVINTYVPNGTQVGGEKWDYKMRWLEHFREFCDDLGSTSDRVIWLGDINIAPTPDDVYESDRHLGGVGHHQDEFDRLHKIVDWGWTDVFRKFTSGPNHYTFWDFRIPNALNRDLGWRIDHIYASEAMRDKVIRSWVDKEARGKERPSDHAPLLAEFDWS